jgi:hypothetical protein
MSWREMMQRVLQPNVLPPNWVSQPGITSPFADSNNRPPGSTNPHRGVDFNYRTGKYARLLNLSHPALRGPVTGIVTHAGVQLGGSPSEMPMAPRMKFYTLILGMLPWVIRLWRAS